MKTLIIDAGHGGTDPGANGFGIQEKSWNLKMSLYQYKRLKELGANVSLTRSSDETIKPTQRADKVKNKYDYCISNHFNAFNGNARGIETIHSIHANPKFATNLAHAIKNASTLPLRRVFQRQMSHNTDWYFMHRLTGKTETVIIEYGFIDNAKDFAFYQNEQNFYQVAEAVVKVLCQQLNIQYKASQNDPLQKLYYVQAGAFAQKENAERQVQALKKAGFNAFINHQ